jgi:signal peptidase I
MSPRLRLALWCVAAALAASLLLKHFVFDVYRVDSGSMEPLIMGSREGGERVLVHYGTFRPKRFDLVVAMRPGEERPVVKRAVALENERVQIVSGDLVIDGRRLGISQPRPAPIAVLDPRPGAWVEAFHVEQPSSLKRVDNGALLTAEADDPARLLLREDVHDDGFDVESGHLRGQQSVNDLLLDVEFELSPGASAGFELTELGDLFRVELRPEQTGWRCELIREGEGVLAWDSVSDAKRLRLVNLDDTLVMRLDQREAKVVTYAENRLDPRDVIAAGRHMLPRVRLWVRSGTLKLLNLCLQRDLYYTERGDFARAGALRLGLGECFLLGDNSAMSRDGREWGPTPLEQIIGHPTRVVWPLSRWRPLGAPSALEVLSR